MKKTIFLFILAAVLAFGGTSPAALAETAGGVQKDLYTDISGHWAAEAINKVVDVSLFADGNGKFEPDKAITRSEFVSMLHKALGIRIEYFAAPDITRYFDDVKNEDPFAPALNDLVTANIIDYKGSFRPGATLSREDMVHFIINSLEYVTGGNYAMIQIYPEPFADDADINPAYKNDFVKAQVLKLALGTGNRLFLPDRSATRAEAAMMVFRLVNLTESLKPQKVQVSPSIEQGSGNIVLRLTIANNTGNTVTINHSSGQKYDFMLLGQDKNILYTWSADKSFIAALTSTVLEPGQSVEFSDTIPRGDFMDKAVYMKALITGTSDEFAINPDGYEIPIIE